MNKDKQQVAAAPVEVPAADKCVDCGKACCAACDNDSRSNLHACNWLADVPGNTTDDNLVEVHFKNTRRGFYRNSANLDLHEGDLVAVEANPGHDIGTVAMTGKLVKLQMKRANLRPDIEILRVFRKAKQADIERFEAAKAREVDTMIRSRKIAADLNLNMKIGDVEYQGDGNKAIFYYIADGRVDFRQLIKVLADVFKIRVEMKQIGARQEAGRIGGIGPCGRPLCCASWMTNFVSVATSAARFQDISLNPQKLAGQCAKLKCCINFEVDGYVEAVRQLPPRDVPLETADGTYYHFKTDVYRREMTYSTDKRMLANAVTLTPERVREVIALNRDGVKPEKLQGEASTKEPAKSAYGDLVGQDSISRFDKKKKKKKPRPDKNKGEKRHDDEKKPERQDKPRKPNDNKAQRDNKPADNDNRQRRQRNRQGNNRNNDRTNRDNSNRKPADGNKGE